MQFEEDDFPIFVMVDPDRESRLGLSSAVLRVHPPGADPLLAIFTDEDLARRFGEDIRMREFPPRAIESPKELLAIAEYFQKNGIKDVARDISFHPPTIQTSSIASFITSLRQISSSN